MLAGAVHLLCDRAHIKGGRLNSFLSDYSARNVTTTFLDRGPSNSTSTILCHVPSTNWPIFTGWVTDVPIMADSM